MPVGEADKGIGASKGSIYYGLQMQSMFIDWWHDPLEKEPFKHSGNLNTFLLRPSMIYGMSPNLNLMASTTLGIRSMNWSSKEKSIHHRTESSHSDFDNAHGNILGDTDILLRYLVKNAGHGEGLRFFIGGGLVVPSKSVLTSDPFFLNNKEEVKEHRHFSLSSGAYKYILEQQVFIKRETNPVFYGGFILYKNPISESEYGYRPSPTLNVSLSMTFKRFDQRDSSVGYSVAFFKSGQAYWNGLPSPNSQSTSFIPGISYLINSRFGALSFNIQKPFFIDGSFSSNEGNIGQGSNIWQFTISLRKV
ncbi:MAG: hypothetical protein VYB52_03375 [Candidatus Neomarinimicrobiota bacterium]|nr:hypothetical protein [Candidatus Neomarinimicrobiota bacterium]MEC7871720.1 hypothetical protein [Candidatus Neomarinimicrobiota bacterium]MED5433871.1 hypothetical protein [Candidatus Neomarinimicrobiota bacterium]MEE3302762.1 hypothetical protein [Candidatus Neomarinimicrobiota bacterium]